MISHYNTNPQKQPTLVAIADDHCLIRQSVVTHLEEHGDIKVICAVPDGRSLIQFLEETNTQPKTCIVDIQMHDMDGIQTLSYIKANWPEIKVLLLTGFVSERNVMLAGNKKVNGFLSKQDDPNELREAVLHLNTYARYFNKHLTRDQFDRATDLNLALPQFTKKELQLIKLAGSDLLYKEIAVLLNCSETSVASAYGRLYKKTNTKSKSSLFKYAIDNGITIL